MGDVWGQMPGGEQIIIHDFSHDYYCGKCGCHMGSRVAHHFECPTCHLMYNDGNSKIQI